ncbi:hypothetical protein [Celeribacter sp.]|uniref:hypothetical protein n=1 Tax=Celeribacter sp. TaxID=1890673 RepID=UPI003A9434C1
MRLPVLLALLALPQALAAQTISISQFTFRDNDGNGIYDIADAPFVGAEVVLNFDGRGIRTHSNLNGFANFVLGAGSEDADIRHEGRGVLNPVAPRGMFFSSDANARVFDAIAVPDSVSGLAVQPTFPFLGLAVSPQVTVHAYDAIALTCSHGSDTQSVPFADHSFASCAIPPDLAEEDWHISVEFTDGGTRDLGNIVPGFRNIILSALVDSAAPEASALKMEGFDTVLTTRDVREMPRLADGLTFHNLVVAHRRFYGGPGYVNCVTSGEFLAYTSSGHPATISKSGGFVPVSMELGYAWDGAGEGHAIIEGYRDGEVVHSINLKLSTSYPVTFLPQWGHIDRMVIRHSSYWQVLVDDFTYTD